LVIIYCQSFLFYDEASKVRRKLWLNLPLETGPAYGKRLVAGLAGGLAVWRQPASWRGRPYKRHHRNEAARDGGEPFFAPQLSNVKVGVHRRQRSSETKVTATRPITLSLIVRFSAKYYVFL
jgi:hypothetical protein